MILNILKLLGSRVSIVIFSTLWAVVSTTVLIIASKQNAVAFERQEQMIKALELFKVKSELIHEMASKTINSIEILTIKTNQIMEKYDEISKVKPLPDNCIIDNHRLQIINQAIESSVLR